MRLLLVNVAVAPENDPFVLEVLAPAWKRNFDLVRSPGTQITSRFCTWGVRSLDGFFYHYLDTLNSTAVFHAAKNADEEGFDAVLIMCFGNPMLPQLRQALDIPVVSLGESSIYLSAQMGARFGVITISPYTIFESEHLIDGYGLSKRLAGMCAIPESAEQQAMALKDVHGTIEALQEPAAKLIEKGAEVLIPGCGLMSPALRLAVGAEDEYPSGYTEVDGVPLLDLLGAGLTAAEHMAKLREGGSPWISRKGLYVKPSDEGLAAGSDVLSDSRLAFWDVEL